MPDIRRNRIPGATYFFTVNLLDRRCDLLVAHTDALRDAIRKVRDRAIWQRRYWEHTIRDDRDYAAHIDYVHFNPVKHGLVDQPADWPFSSFQRCVIRGLYPADWLGGEVDLAETGERQ